MVVCYVSTEGVERSVRLTEGGRLILRETSGFFCETRNTDLEDSFVLENQISC
jgi:hypothetical protein